MNKNQNTQTSHAELVSASSTQTLNQVQGDTIVNNRSTVQLFNRSTAKQFAFTLAEVLITITIIGVVAAMTIPNLLSNTNEKSLNTSDSVFQRRLGEALKVMNLQGTLQGQPSTQAFVDELGKHIKIMKTCPSSELSNCFVSEFTVGEETIEVSDLTKSKNLYKTTDYGTETIGVVFGNGTRALIAYKPNCRQDQFDNSNTTSPVKLTTTGTGKNAIVSLGTDSLSILYNLQERKNNNEYNAGNSGNIRGINVSLWNGCLGNKKALGFCIKDIADFSKFKEIGVVDCTNKSAEDYSYCENSTWTDHDYWATAKKYCGDKKLELINRDQLGKLADYLYGASNTGANGNTNDKGGKNINENNAKAISSLFVANFDIWSNTSYAWYYAYNREFNSTYSQSKYNERRVNSNRLAVCIGK